MSKFDNSIFSTETDDDFMDKLNAIGPDDTQAIGALVVEELNTWLQSSDLKTDAALASAVKLGIAVTAIRDGEDATKATMFLIGFAYTRWKLQAIGLERIAGMGHNSERAMKKNRNPTPITNKARKLILDGVPIRKVADICGVNRSVVERWRKEILKK